MRSGITKSQFLQLCAELWDKEAAQTPDDHPINCEFIINVRGLQVSRRRMRFDDTQTFPRYGGGGFAAMNPTGD